MQWWERSSSRAKTPTLRRILGAAVLSGLLFACGAGAGDPPPDDTAPAEPSGRESASPDFTPLPSIAEAPSPAEPQRDATLKFDSGRAWEHLRRQVAFGPRPAGSAALAECRQYIVEELANAGIMAREDPFDADTPLGRVRMVNVIGTIPGRRPERIALATHYDTKLFRDIRFVGASDGASSTAAVLELGRVLKGRQNEYSIELLFFDGEEAVVDWYKNEDNTYGSRHYVQAAERAGTLSGLKALVLLDLIGDRNLNIRRDSNSTLWLTDIIWGSAASLGYHGSFWSQETAVEDDHLPFLRAGVPAVDIIDLDYAVWHTALDDLDHVSARSLQIVGDVVLHALPRIEQRLSSQR